MIPEAVLKRSFELALDQVVRCYQQDSTQAKPTKFSIEIVVQLEDGTEVRCRPEGIIR